MRFAIHIPSLSFLSFVVLALAYRTSVNLSLFQPVTSTRAPSDIAIELAQGPFGSVEAVINAARIFVAHHIAADPVRICHWMFHSCRFCIVLAFFVNSFMMK